MTHSVRDSAHARPIHRLESLSFTSSRPRGRPGRDFWCVATTGDYWTDCRLGNRFAAEAIAHMRRHGDVHLMTDIAAAMIRRTEFDGIEVGFFMALGRVLLGGDAEARATPATILSIGRAAR